MALRTNKLAVSVDTGAFDRRYDVFEVMKEGEGKLSWSSRVFEPFGTPYILSIFGQGGDRPFYILAPKDAVTVKELRTHFEKCYGGEIADEDLEPSGVAESLLPKKVLAAELPHHVLVQLLLNALYASNGDGKASLQNVTGHLFCFKTGKEWVRKTGDKRPYQIIGLEFRVTKEMLLKVDVRTFTRANAAGLKFEKRKKGEYPRYVVDFAGPTMRRVAPGERPRPDDVYIQKQYEGKKSKIPFLKYKNLEAFRNSKCGVMQELLERFNTVYRGIVSLRFSEVDESKRVPVPKKLLKPDYGAWFSRGEYVVVDVARDAASKVVCEAVADWLVRDDCLGKRPRIVTNAIVGANNLLIIHERAYCRDLGIDDPYAPSIILGAACQHLTVEAVQPELGKEGSVSNLRFIIPKCLVEAAVKQDVCKGVMSLYDWSVLEQNAPVVFALAGPETEEERTSRERGEAPKKYSFLEVAPDGALAFHQGSLNDAGLGSRWGRLAYELASEWSFRTDGFVIGDDNRIDVIETTDGFPVPDLDKAKNAVESIDWSLGKDDVLAVLSVVTGDSALDAALTALCRWVSELHGPRVKATTLNALVKDASNLGSGPYSARHIRDLLDKRFEDMFARRLQTCVPRNKDAQETIYEPIMGMHCLKEGNVLRYWVNSFEGLNQTGRSAGCVIRQVRNTDGDAPFSEGLFETLAVPIARLGNASVLPLPFKYLREWMAMREIG